ncbi:enoyl-CoA hydratase/isomerase family protein [Pseudonocardia xishanensis]|uniref:Crotonase/enoyl-CoA hydratase family protein n=1 Tax=Pseudonocardia xishanensis TaxID=630995 RepID=A0ABP8RV37_9PSEU
MTLHRHELGDGIVLVEIDRPDSHNALDRNAQYELDAVLADLDGVRALVLAGAGGRALSAGWDIHEMRALSADESLRLGLEREEWLWRWFTAPVPTVAAVQGIAYGVGALLAACADLRVGGPGTRFAVTGMSYGYPALTWLLPELLGASRAAEVLLTGEVAGPRAAEIGLLNRYSDTDDGVRDAAVQMARTVAALPPGGVRAAKRLLRDRLRPAYDAENASARRALVELTPAELFAGFPPRRSPRD